MQRNPYGSAVWFYNHLILSGTKITSPVSVSTKGFTIT